MKDNLCNTTILKDFLYLRRKIMIETDRLVLRKFVILDKHFLFKLNNDKEVNKFRSSDSRPLNKCEDDIIKWNKK